MSRWKRYWALPPAERRLRRRALAVLAWARLRLSLQSFARVRAWTERAAAPEGGAAASPLPPAAVDRAVRSAATFVPGATCLVKAMAGRILLGRSGVECGLRLGLAKDGEGGLDAHAWVECADGTVVGDRGRPDYAAVGI